jgi:hypothetical protein
MTRAKPASREWSGPRPTPEAVRKPSLGFCVPGRVLSLAPIPGHLENVGPHAWCLWLLAGPEERQRGSLGQWASARNGFCARQFASRCACPGFAANSKYTINSNVSVLPICRRGFAYLSTSDSSREFAMTMLTGLGSVGPEPAPSGREAQQPPSHTANQASDQAVENAALAGAAAIRRVIGERNELRRERERLSAVNDELRDQMGKITTARDHHVQLASDLFAQLKHIHHTIQGALQKTQGLSLAPEDRDATLIDLARRFSPAGSRLQGKRD